MPLPTTRTSPIMVEREAEITALERLVSDVADGHSRMVLLTGEAGIGKSRMAREITRRCQEYGFDLLAGKCSERDHDFPLAPFVDALRQRLASTNEDPTTFLGPQAAELAELLPEHSHLATSASAEAAVLPEQGKRRLFENIASLLRRLSERHPLLLLLEDLHWSDPTSLELLELLPRRLERTRLLVLGTCRSNEASKEVIRSLTALQRERVSHLVSLNPLTRNGVASVLEAMLPAPPPQHLISTVHTRTGGNPFMIEELVALVSETGPRPFTNPVVPTTVRDIVYQQIEGLDVTILQVADLAAVAGERVDFDFLLSVSTLDRNTFVAALHTLVEHRILTEVRGNGTAVIAFRHALTRDALLDRLLTPERKSLHHVVADALENTFGQSPPAHICGDLGYHFHAAEEWDKALIHATCAGQSAWDVQASAEAFSHFRRALDAAIALDDDCLPDLYCRCGQALALLGAFDESEHYLRSALRHARDRDQTDTEQQALYALAGLFASHDYLTAHDFAQQALSVARSQRDRSWEAKTLNRLGNILTNLMQFTDGRALHKEALEIVNGLEDQWSIADSLDHIGMSHYLLGEIPEARESFRKAAAIFTRTGDSERAASVLTSRGLYLAVLDGACATDFSPSSSRSDAETGLRLSREIGWRAGEVYALVAVATTELGDARFEEALHHLDAALAIANEIDHPQWTVIGRLALGILHAEILDDVGALQHFNSALGVAREVGSRQWVERLEAWIARCELRINARGAQSSPLPYPLFPESMPAAIGQRRALITLIEQELDAGRLDRALSLTDRLFRQSAGPQATEVVLLRAEVLAALERRAEADAAYLEARRLAQEYGPKTFLWRVAAGRSRLWDGNDAPLAHTEAATARHLIEAVAESIPATALRTTFLRAPEVRP